MCVYYALASTYKDIFRLDLSAATRIYAKNGLAETSFLIAVNCVYVSWRSPDKVVSILIFRMKDSLSTINPNEVLQLYIQCTLPYLEVVTRIHAKK